MAYQLVYTSAAKLLDAGRSGFGTVARSKSISPLVVSAIERVSQFSNLRGNDRSRMIFVHRRIVAANNRFHVLSRICDAGADYTGRTHHIAHHLIVTQDEVARAAARGLTPADVLRQFVWLDRWDGAARFYGPSDDVPLEMFQPAARNAQRSEWTRLTGNPTLARTLAWDGAPRTGVLLVPREADALALMGEALHEFGNQSWSRSFTTSLETTDEMSDIDWVISNPTDFPEIQARCGARTTLDLSHPKTLPVPSEPAPIAQARQPAAEPRTRESGAFLAPTDGGSTAARSPQPGKTTHGQKDAAAGQTSPDLSLTTPRKKQAVPALMAALTVLMLALLGVIAWETISNNSNDTNAKPIPKIDSKKPKPTTRNDDSANKRILTDAGMSELLALEIINKTGEQYKEWANFIAKFIDEIASGKASIDPSDCGEPPSQRIPTSAPDWLSLMVESRILIVRYCKSSDEDISLKERLNILDEIHIKMKSLSEKTGNTKLDIAILKKFDAMLVKIGIQKAMLPDSGKKLLKHLIDTDGPIFGGQFSYDEWPDRYKVLCEIVRDNFVKFATIDMKRTISSNPNIIRKDDSEQFSEAVDYWLHSENPPSQKFINNLRSNVAFVPNDFPRQLEQRRNPPNKDSSQTKKKEGEHSSVVNHGDTTQAPVVKSPAKQVILVSRDQLRNGIEVRLLKELLNVYSGDTLKKNGLTFIIGDEPIGKELIEVSGKGYFSTSYLGSADEIKIYKDGKLSIDRDGVDSIKLTYKTPEKSWESFVVADVPNEKPLVENIKFEHAAEGEDAAVIKGDLAVWIRGYKNQTDMEGTLKAILDPEIPEIAFVSVKEEYRLTRPPQTIPEIIFRTSDVQLLVDAVKSYKNNIKLISGKTVEKKNESRSKITDEFKNKLILAIGGCLLYHDLGDNSKDSGIILRDCARKILAEKYKIERKSQYTKDDEAEKDIDDIKTKIGEKKLHWTLTILGNDPEGFNGIEKAKIREEYLDKCINTIIRNTKKPDGRMILDENIRKIRSITILTKKGRVFFKATPD